MNPNDLIRRGDALHIAHEIGHLGAIASIAALPAVTDQNPVAHAYVIDGECEQIDWGTDADLPDDPALVLLYDRPAVTDPQIATLQATNARLVDAETFYIDCEFDGHDGPLLSIAIVRGDGWSLHVKVNDIVVEDPWVQENVLPILDSHHADLSWHVRPNEVGTPLRGFIGDCHNPTIIADSPVDIGRFCRAISTGEDGGWYSSGYPGMTFIVHNVDCYPTKLAGAVQHNAWWDAMALRNLLAELGKKA